MFKICRMKPIGLTAFSLCCLAVFIGVCFLMLRASAPDTVTIDGESYSLNAEDDADIAAFLDVCGCRTEELLSDRELTIPKHWNRLYESYNELQRSQGFDLTPNKGKPARELIYACADSEEYVTLLIGGGRIIATHICGADGGGMRPLIKNGE